MGNEIKERWPALLIHRQLRCMFGYHYIKKFHERVGGAVPEPFPGLGIGFDCAGDPPQALQAKRLASARGEEAAKAREIVLVTRKAVRCPRFIQIAIRADERCTSRQARKPVRLAEAKDVPFDPLTVIPGPALRPFFIH